MSTVKKWTKKTRESDDAFAAFCSYRDQLAPRRLFAVRVNGLPVQAEQVADWYRGHAWQERVEAYDAYMDEVRLEAREKQLALSTADLTARHVGIGAEFSEIVQTEATKLRDRVANGAITHLKPIELIKAWETLVKLDRLVSGQTTERVEVYDYTKLSEQELETLANLLAKAQPSDDK